MTNISKLFPRFSLIEHFQKTSVPGDKPFDVALKNKRKAVNKARRDLRVGQSTKGSEVNKMKKTL